MQLQQVGDPETLTRIARDGKRSVIAELGGGPNGAAIGPDGAVYVTNNGGAWGWTGWTCCPPTTPGRRPGTGAGSRRPRRRR